MYAHQFWRILITESFVPGDVHSLAGVDWIPGDNIVRVIPVGRWASSELSGYPLPAAYDGNANTFWAANTAGPGSWLAGNFGSNTELHGVILTARNDAYSYQAPKKFKVQYSDDTSTWYDYWESPEQSAWDAGETRVFWVEAPPQNVWRLRFTSTTSQGGDPFVAFNEVSFRTSPGGSNAATGGFPLTSLNLNIDAYKAEYAVDGDVTATGDQCWVSGSNAPEVWFAYYFPSAINIVEYAIWPRPSFWGQSPTQWVLEKSTDGGATWTTMDTQTGQSFSSGVANIYTVPSSGGDVSADGSIVATSTVTGISAVLVETTGIVTANSAVSGAGKANKRGIGFIEGQSAVSGAGKANFTATGNVAGNLNITGVARVVVQSSGYIASSSTVSGVSARKNAVSGSISGVLTVAGVGNVLVVGASTGVVEASVAVSGVGKALSKASGSVEGSLSVTGRSNKLIPAVGNVNTTATISGVGASRFLASGLVAAQLAVTGVGESQESSVSIGSIFAQSAVSGAGKSLYRAVGSATGTVAVSGRTAKLASSRGQITGILTVTGVSVAPVTTDTPPERTFIVPLQSRKYVLAEMPRTFVLRTQKRTLTYEDGMADGTFPERTVFDDLDYSIDFTRFLKEGETIVSHEVEVSSGNMVAYNDGVLEDNEVVFWLKEGEVSTTTFQYVDIKIVTSAGRKRKIKMGIKVEP